MDAQVKGTIEEKSLSISATIIGERMIEPKAIRMRPSAEIIAAVFMS
jgi:hypothetical protein